MLTLTLISLLCYLAAASIVGKDPEFITLRDHPPWPRPPHRQHDERYAIRSHIALDKPVYKPNDVMFIEVFAVDALNKLPATEVELSRRLWDGRQRAWAWTKYYTPTNATISIRDANSHEIFSSAQVTGANGTFAFTFKIPESQPGGEYFIRTQYTSGSGRFLHDFTSERKFRIESYAQPEQHVTVDFERNFYSPGEKVSAKVKVKTQGGEPILPGSTITFRVEFPDSKEQPVVQQSGIALSQEGEAVFSFDIPADAQQQLLTLTLQTFYGTSEVPIISSHSVSLIDLMAFQVIFNREMHTSDQPEYLVANIPNKVYFWVLSENKDPESSSKEKEEFVEFARAELVEKQLGANGVKEKVLQDIAHVHNGRSSFVFTPHSDIYRYQYYLRVYRHGQGGEISKEFELPETNPLLTAQMTVLNEHGGVLLPSEEYLELRIDMNARFNASERAFKLAVDNQGQVIFDRELNLTGPQHQYYRIPISSFYKNATHGGVFTISLEDIYKHEFRERFNALEDKINFRRKILVLPKDALKARIETDK